MKYIKYSVCNPDDTVESFQVPSVWTPSNVGDKFCHSLVAFKVPRGHHLLCAGGEISFDYAMISKGVCYKIGSLPTTVDEFHQAWTDYVKPLEV